MTKRSALRTKKTKSKKRGFKHELMASFLSDARYEDRCWRSRVGVTALQNEFKMADHFSSFFTARRTPQSEIPCIQSAYSKVAFAKY